MPRPQRHAIDDEAVEQLHRVTGDLRRAELAKSKAAVAAVGVAREVELRGPGEAQQFQQLWGGRSAATQPTARARVW